MTDTVVNHTWLEKRAFALNRALMGIALVLLLFYLVVYIAFAINLIRFPFDYDQGEGFELVDVMMFSDGQWPYQDIETYPFYGSIYPPFYHIILVPFAWIFGPEYWYGRLFSFLSTLITACAIGFAVWLQERRTNTTRLVAIMAGLAFLSSNTVYHIGPLFRQHISMIMFETLGIVTLAYAHTNTIAADSRRRRRFMLAGFGLLLMAGYTKQLAAFTAIPALAFVFIRNPRRGILWGIGFALIGSGIFAGLTFATHGHWWTQTVTANIKDFRLDQALGLLRLFIRLHLWLLIPAGLLVIYELYFDRLSIYSLWLVGLLPPISYSAGTWGAGDSYYATPIAAVCILSGIFAARTLNRSWTFRRNYLSRWIIDPFRRFLSPIALTSLVVIPLLYLGYGYTVFHIPTNITGFRQIADVLHIQPNADNGFYDSAGRITGGYSDTGHFVTQADLDAGYRIVDYIDTIDPNMPVLSEEAGFCFAAGREVITNPVVLYILDQGDDHPYDSTELVHLIENQEFGLVILRASFYPTAVNDAITAHYTASERITMNGFDYVICRPSQVGESTSPCSINLP